MPATEDIQQRIKEVFPASPFLGLVTNGCKCDECSELSKSFGNKSWNTLSEETMNAQFGSLPLLSQDAYRAFLPAWLVRSLDQLESENQKFREWTLHSIAIYFDDHENDTAELVVQPDKLRSRFEKFTSDQVELVVAVLRLIRDQACISSWDRDSIDRALDVLASSVLTSFPTHRT